MKDYDASRLPPPIIRNKARAIGLTTDPKTLRFVREKRYKESKYANMSTCTEELSQANQIFLQYKIPIIVSDGRSIEETATQVAQLLSLEHLPRL
ncbi:MAG: kinase/pyrophosphorylase [Desulfocapsa sp.]|nr:kinase/pyrophosphorylase [Desulfocapsa sp.]